MVTRRRTLLVAALAVRAALAAALAGGRRLGLALTGSGGGGIAGGAGGPSFTYSGTAPFTTFDDRVSACRACVTYYPEREEASGVRWKTACRAGACDFYDPVTQGVGGVVGLGPGGGVPNNNKTCFTLDDVPWYADCEAVLRDAATSIHDVAQYCSYREQLFVPAPPLPPSAPASSHSGATAGAGSPLQLPSLFANVSVPFQRLGKSHEECSKTIAREGAALFSTMSACDTDMEALSSCCESVYNVLSCVTDLGGNSDKWPHAIADLQPLKNTTAPMMRQFSEYCEPLCKFSRAEFCQWNPTADPCVPRHTCAECTQTGGAWCPRLGECHCARPGVKLPCVAEPIFTPLRCAAEEEASAAGPLLRGAVAAAGAAPTRPAGVMGARHDLGIPECRYSEIAPGWKPLAA